MDKTIRSLAAAVAALVLSGGAYAQANNTLATPTTRSPAAVSPDATTSGYGTPGSINSESGMSAESPNAGMQNNMNDSSMSSGPAYGINNTLATPTTKSPAQSH